MTHGLFFRHDKAVYGCIQCKPNLFQFLVIRLLIAAEPDNRSDSERYPNKRSLLFNQDPFKKKTILLLKFTEYHSAYESSQYFWMAYDLMIIWGLSLSWSNNSASTSGKSIFFQRILWKWLSSPRLLVGKLFHNYKKAEKKMKFWKLISRLCIGNVASNQIIFKFFLSPNDNDGSFPECFRVPLKNFSIRIYLAEIEAYSFTNPSRMLDGLDCTIFTFNLQARLRRSSKCLNWSFGNLKFFLIQVPTKDRNFSKPN